uniref:FUSC family protein n=1 Tax=Gordonia sp. B7-2 TaxID=3420932 RepID=UPI003D936EF7
MSETASALAAAFRPSTAPLAVSSAVRALVAGGALLLLGLWLGDWDKLGVAYLGAACSVAFVIGDSYRSRLTALAAQGLGAVVGLVVGGSTAGSPLVMIVVAALAGSASGFVGAAALSGPAFGMMLSIGVAFGQFGGSTLDPAEQAAWYVIGALAIGVVHVADWPFRHGSAQRRYAATVCDAAADLCELIGRGDARAARTRMAAASAQARDAGWDSTTERVAHATAALYAEKQPVPVSVVTTLRTAGMLIRAGRTVQLAGDWPLTTPGLRAMSRAVAGDGRTPTGPDHGGGRTVLHPLATRESAHNAVRMALCMGVATAITVALHDPQHSFWLPLTVAVIVRPEYASIFVRTMNRVAGTLVGALIAAAVLAFWDSGSAVAVAASVGLAFAALTAPRLYALSVVGVTLSAILAASVGGPDTVAPLIRMQDTVLGAVIAVLLGYVCWPGARRLPQQARIDDGLSAAEDYLAEVGVTDRDSRRFVRCRDEAYRRAHGARSACLAAFAEPPPVPAQAREMLPFAMELEEIIDEITSILPAADDAEPPDPVAIDRTRRRLDRLRAKVSATAR